MTQYIVNLTNNLIRKNRYNHTHPFRENFIKDVAKDLLITDIMDMSPETLGKILCSIQTGEVLSTKEELFGYVHFNGNCEDTLRELVACCLAHVIQERLNPHTANEDIVHFRG